MIGRRLRILLSPNGSQSTGLLKFLFIIKLLGFTARRLVNKDAQISEVDVRFLKFCRWIGGFFFCSLYRPVSVFQVAILSQKISFFDVLFAFGKDKAGSFTDFFCS